MTPSKDGMADRRVVIPSNQDGVRLDVALAALSGQSRSQVQLAIRARAVKLNGGPAVARQLVREGDAVTWQPVVASPTTPPSLPTITVLYEDNDLLAIDKPAGLVVHGSRTQVAQPTVAAWAAARGGVIDDDLERPGIVHRLDKDTSGVMVIAKNPAAKLELQRQFKQRTVGKTYLALVRGRLAQPQAVIRLPIGRHRRQPLKQAVMPSAREAVTEYRTLRQYAGATLVEISLHTGRTHQIRVHLSHLGHPVMGDTTYGDAQRPPKLGRQFLHAARLALTTPSGKPLVVESPLPPDLQAFLATLD